MRTSSYKVGNGHHHQSEKDDAYAEDDDGTEGSDDVVLSDFEAVSYTHLTLPTILLV